MLRLLIYAIALSLWAWPSAIADWPCPSAWPEQCYFMNTNMQGGDISSCSATVTTDCWDCPYCPFVFGNVFGTYYDLQNHTSDFCYAPQCSSSVTTDCWDNQASEMEPFVSTVANNCDLFQFDCAKGYYYGVNQKCVACKPRIEAYECDLGFYPKRCPLTMDMSDRDGLCDECVYPALPPDTVGGAAVYRHGFGTLYPDCFLLKPRPGQPNVLNMTTCANFQTPKWSRGWCSIECAVGFVPIAVARPGVIGDLPKCHRCDTACVPGTYPPVCVGGGTSGDGKCLPCTVTLPLNAVWVSGCEWAPKRGYYTDGTGDCLPCLAQACANGSMFMGCHDFSAGSCRPCTISCASSKFFMRSDIHVDQCSCAQCTTSTATTYYSQNCTANADAFITPCRSLCETGFYISKACSLYADLQCKPCSVVPNGRLLLAKCTTNANVDHGPCPRDYACDGSDTPFQCPADRVLTPASICACLSAMSGPLCLPITCPSGWYPDASINGCQSCTQSDSVGALTVPGVMGLAACVCPYGYFIRQSTPKLIHCWPAGDMACDSAVQRQTVSSGLTNDEPTCECGLGPGMQALPFTLVPSELCSATCMSRYTAVAPVDAAIRDAYGFLLLLDSTVMPLVARARGFAVLGPGLLLVLTENGELQVQTPNAIAAFPTINVFLTTFRTTILQIHAVLAHESEPGFAWVLLRFWGYCVGHDDLGVCWVIHLVGLQPAGTATLATCIPSLMMCVTLKTGFDYTPSSAAITAIAVGKASLLVAWNDTLISRYPLSGGSSYAVSDSMAKGVAEAMDGVYTLLESGLLLDPRGDAMSYLPPRLQQVVAFPPGGHLLMVQKADDAWVQVDLWNRFVSPPFAAAAFQRQTLVLSNSTTISAIPCPIDAYSPRPRECESLPCTLAFDACGANSIRPFGASECDCLPGYFRDQGQCVACVGLLYYCPGTTAPMLCPSPSISSGMRASLSDCLCPPRWYHFETLCLPCPVGFFCPSNGTLFPVPCHASGPTLEEGCSSPMQCLCPSRTHGLTCEPCADSDDCAAAPISRTALLLESLNEELMRPCVGAESVFYPGLIVTTNVSVDCLIDNSMQLQVLAMTTLSVREATPYGSRMEWDGKTEASTCIAGYELLIVMQTFGAQAHCFPCLNGTFRPQRALSPLCAPCSDPNAHAPYLAMSACICKAGYNFDASQNACVGQSQTVLYAPWWADTTVPIVLPTVTALVALGGLAYYASQR